MLASKDWVLHFHLAKVSHLLKEVSDHSPILLSTMDQEFRLTKPFRYLNVWSEDISSFHLVEKAWRGINFRNKESRNTVKKLSRMARDFQRWNKMHFGNVFEKIKNLEDSILFLQSKEIPNKKIELELMQNLSELRLQ